MMLAVADLYEAYAALCYTAAAADLLQKHSSDGRRQSHACRGGYSRKQCSPPTIIAAASYICYRLKKSLAPCLHTLGMFHDVNDFRELSDE